MSTPRTGNLQDSPLPDILEALRRAKATGTLSLQNGPITKCVYMKDGQIVFATSSDKRDRLGEILVRTGKLVRENLEHALRISLQSAGTKKLGAILVENGFLPPKELFSGLKTQVNEIIYTLFFWREGIYRFEEKMPSDIIHLQIDFEELIAGIIERIKQGA